MKVLYFEPLKDPVIKSIPNTLEALQKAVGGYIEVVKQTDNPIVVICNEQGKLNGSSPNRCLMDREGYIYDHLYGSFLVCGFSDDDFSDIPDELIDTYKEAFGPPILAVCEEQLDNPETSKLYYWEPEEEEEIEL